ncbi:MAG: hypothetical protein NTV98_03840 [Candidatus Roizmanbacteria bacterium]|nr:hypothetical protein [Candidatus Roizmanbacteria bacterium]
MRYKNFVIVPLITFFLFFVVYKVSATVQLPRISTACELKIGTLFAFNDGFSLLKTCPAGSQRVVLIGDKGDKGDKGDPGSVDPTVLATLNSQLTDLQTRINNLEHLLPTPTPTPGPVTMTITSDDTWRYSESLMAEWDTVTFDDTNWLTSASPLPPSGCTTPPNPSYTGPMWSQNITANSVYFRKTFILNTPTTGSVKASINVGGDVYINGHQVLSGISSAPQTIDVGSYLLTGTNVIAIHASSIGQCSWVQLELTLH